jgi:hypothetical protein
VLTAPVGATPRAPTSRRVDLARPTFSQPADITNPLFPIGHLASVLQLGTDADGSLRQEVTLLPQTEEITWDGQRVETRVSQFVAYSDGRLLEVAVDHFAQADDGSVWYFGEDVANYEDGVVANHDGTWRAGRNGPPGMIMPASPRVGDVYRPENIPGLVFEEVVVKAVDQTVDGPRGPVTGAVLVEEHPMDGAIENKVFAPGYGEFKADVPSEDEHVTVAVASPTDVVAGGVPRPLRRLSRGARSVFAAAPEERWNRLSEAAARLGAAWDRSATGPVPPLLAAEVDDALSALTAAVADRDPAAVRQAALDVSQASLDLQLRHRPPESVDRGRTGVWFRQLLVDGAANDLPSVKGDVAVLGALAARPGASERPT